MKIVFLDAYAANPGDIDWAPWQQLAGPDGEPIKVEIHDRTAPEETLARACDAEILLTNKVVINAELMEALPRLKYIGVLATGYNVVDTDYAGRHGIIVTNIPAYSTASVAQMAMAHLLHIALHVGPHSQSVKEGRWQASRDFCFWDYPLIELSGMNFGIVGLGNSGRRVAEIAPSLDDLFRIADVLSLHCPLTPQTHHLVCDSRLRLMKPTAILINTGRGPLINEQDLADALNEGRLYAAGLDVLEKEPPRNGSPLITARNCYITPHIAWATLQARKRLMSIALQNVEAYLGGKPQNVVSR